MIDDDDDDENIVVYVGDANHINHRLFEIVASITW